MALLLSPSASSTSLGSSCPLVHQLTPPTLLHHAEPRCDSSTIEAINRELPAYTEQISSGPIIHSFHIKDKRDHAWLTLQVQSRVGSVDRPPRVIEGRPIEGTVSLDLNKESKVKSIVVSVVGELVTDLNFRYGFAHTAQELWPSTSGRHHPEFKAGLSGNHSWPFNLELPKSVELDHEDGVKQSYRLPANTYMRYTRVTIVYRIRVVVKHGLFRPSHSLTKDLTFIPLIQPPPFPVLRKRTYEQKAPLPAPDADPEGWHSLPALTLKGQIFGDRDVEVTYILSLAKPLSYVRGTVIPLHLTVQSSDPHALDLFSTQTAPLIRLRRIHFMNHDAGGSNYSEKEAKLADSSMVVDAMCDGRRVDKDVAREIHLTGSLTPSSHLGLYKLSYDVAVFDPRALGFVTPPKKKFDEPLQTMEVEIGTVYPVGPRPIAYSPPTYEEEEKDHPPETRGTRFNQFTSYDLAS